MQEREEKAGSGTAPTPGYGHIIRAMTWSFSRLSTFETCPYKFFITYVKPCSESRLFFASFGSFVHRLLAEFFSGAKTKEQVIHDYLLLFRTEVASGAPNEKLFSRYFLQGLECLKRLEMPSESILGVEEFVQFSVGDFPFIGFIDLQLKNAANGIVLCDHKSHDLKPRSGKSHSTKSDEELDRYLRQLYLYSIPIQEKYGVLPAQLVFNCYRTGNVVSERFSAKAFEETKEWAASVVEQAIRAVSWEPRLDWYYCRYICGVHNDCEYYLMSNSA